MTDPDITILEALTKQRGTFVSGNELAQTLEMSRVGVWARLEKMRTQGFSIAAVRHRGYRLDDEPDRLHHALMQAYLQQDGEPITVLSHETVDSTNSEAERELANGREAPFVVVAGQQTRGRGRFGREWYSPQVGNLYASFAFRPQVAHQRIQTITLWLGLQVCHYLSTHYQVPVAIKWPNDILLDGKKLAGMLTEARIDADRTRDLIFGLGLNVTEDTFGWPEALRQVATTLAMHTATPIRFNELAVDLVRVCVEGYEKFLETDVREELAEMWTRYDFLKGQTVTWEEQGKRYEGIAAGLAEDGSLEVRVGSEVKTLRSGEVSLSKAQAATVAV